MRIGSFVFKIQGDYLSGKPGNISEFDSCRGNVRDCTKCQENNLVREKLLKLFIASCKIASIHVFSAECCEPLGNFTVVWRVVTLKITCSQIWQQTDRLRTLCLRLHACLQGRINHSAIYAMA